MRLWTYFTNPPRARQNCPEEGEGSEVRKRRYRFPYIFFGVRSGDERGFELRGRPVDAALQHPAMKFGEPRCIGCLRGIVVGDGLVGEEDREHRARAIDGCAARCAGAEG